MLPPSNHLVIFTPRALTIDNGVPPSSTDLSEAFTQWLAAKAQAQLDLFSVATKSVGGTDLDDTFDNFLQALEVTDCAIIVIPGNQIFLLDAIYPRLLVHLTVKPQWLQRMLLVSLGEISTNGKKFDPTIFSHPPVIFSTSSNNWESEHLQWEEIADFIRPRPPSARPPSPHVENTVTLEEKDEGSGSLCAPSAGEPLPNRQNDASSESGNAEPDENVEEGRHSSAGDAVNESAANPGINEKSEIPTEEAIQKTFTIKSLGAAATSMLLLAVFLSFLKSKISS